MRITGIDPGTEYTGIAIIETKPLKILYNVRVQNEMLLSNLRKNVLILSDLAAAIKYTDVAIEECTPYGQKVGNEVFKTIWWSGVFWQALNDLCDKMPTKISRKKVLGTLLHEPACKGADAKIKKHIVDQFGLEKFKAPNKKMHYILDDVESGKNKNDMWAACAVALTHYDLEIRYNCKF